MVGLQVTKHLSTFDHFQGFFLFMSIYIFSLDLLTFAALKRYKSTVHTQFSDFILLSLIPNVSLSSSRMQQHQRVCAGINSKSPPRHLQETRTLTMHPRKYETCFLKWYSESMKPQPTLIKLQTQQYLTQTQSTCVAIPQTRTVPRPSRNTRNVCRYVILLSCLAPLPLWTMPLTGCRKP